jgi:signal transduction histidine kinase
LSDSPATQHTTIYFSQRLAGWNSHFILLLTTTLSIFSLLGWFGGSPSALLALLLLIVYAAVGTVGWRRLLQSYSVRAVQYYFLAQFVIITLLLAIELASGVTGLSTSILGFGLMLQAAVLPARMRLWLFVGLLLLIALFYTPSIHTPFFDAQQIALYALIFAPIYGAGLFLGLLIVREEQARETSLRLDDSNRKLAQYAAEIETLSTIQERNRLAREIHDNLGHYLTAVNMQLEVALLGLAQTDTPARTPLLQAQLLTKEALAEIRHSISALRATPLENHGLHGAITLLVNEHRATGKRVEFRISGTPRPCSPTVDMAFYRIVQEGLTNIRKHAPNAAADVILNYSEPDTVMLEVHDDGAGSSHPDSGLGLVGIRERVQLLGGTLTITTTPGQGFSLRAVIPSKDDVGHAHP